MKHDEKLRKHVEGVMDKVREHVEGVMDKNGHCAGSISTKLKLRYAVISTFNYIFNDVSSPLFVILVA